MNRFIVCVESEREKERVDEIAMTKRASESMERRAKWQINDVPLG